MSVFPSPDGLSVVSLDFYGEIRFGPSYFKLSINDKPLRGRLFGDEILWSQDSAFVAVQEWLTTSEKEGPYTSLACFRPASNQQCEVSRTKGGFIVPKSFLGDRLIYATQRYSPNGCITAEHTIELDTFPGWNAL